MNPFKKAFDAIEEKTGLGERTILWSALAVVFMILFSALFTFPANIKIRTLDEENALLKAQIEEQTMLTALDQQLNTMIQKSYPDIEKLNSETFEEERLLELPAAFEAVAIEAGVTLVAIHPQSVDDGAQVAIDVIFQGDISNLYQLMKTIGRVKYAKKLEELNILALSDAEQLQLKFKVPIQ